MRRSSAAAAEEMKPVSTEPATSQDGAPSREARIAAIQRDVKTLNEQREELTARRERIEAEKSRALTEIKGLADRIAHGDAAARDHSRELRAEVADFGIDTESLAAAIATCDQRIHDAESRLSAEMREVSRDQAVRDAAVIEEDAIASMNAVFDAIETLHVASQRFDAARALLRKEPFRTIALEGGSGSWARINEAHSRRVDQLLATGRRVFAPGWLYLKNSIS